MALAAAMVGACATLASRTIFFWAALLSVLPAVFAAAMCAVSGLPVMPTMTSTCSAWCAMFGMTFGATPFRSIRVNRPGSRAIALSGRRPPPTWR